MASIISTDRAPGAIGPYSQAVRSGRFVFTSGQIAVDPASGELVGATVAEQTEQICKNLGAILSSARSGFSRVVKTTCYLADMADFAAFNEVYGRYFTSLPARSCVAAAALPKGALAEIEVVAEVSDDSETWI